MSGFEERRAARKAALAVAKSVQREIDLEAVDALEIEYGDENVKLFDVPFQNGSVTLAAVRLPTIVEAKRYRDRLKHAKKDAISSAAIDAAAELGAQCVVYPPEGELRTNLLKTRTDLAMQLGVAAIELTQGVEAAEGKG